mmetsp:Transcript_3610/g.5486  ORF Transcript_3610/g.5486 Transcript_3610/m.5486 type:complete len:510 (+) Transcript_3610:200-1729(+)
MIRLLKYLTLAPSFLVCSAGALNSNVVSNLADLPFDENNHLSAHILAYPASGPCGALIEAKLHAPFLYGHDPVAVEGEAAEALFGSRIPSEASAVSDCPAVCLDRGVDSYLVAYPLPEKYYNPEKDSHETFENFVASKSCGRVEFGFINYSGTDLALYWVNGANVETYMYPFLQKERNTRFVTTFIGHKFVAKDPETGMVFLEHTVEFNGVMGIGNHINYHRERDIRKEVKQTMSGEWTKHLQVKRTFSALGFDTGRLPNDIFGSMRAFYYNNRKPPNRLLEEWDSKGVYVNYWETDCNFIQIPWELKFIWQERLKDVVQEWVGETEIEQTDLYGMRQYEAGARLLTHVDRITTHAVSLIVNVAQGNLTDPWTVEVYDHANRLHEVVMEPGTIVYYESAKALHGRNSPLAGGFYANLFTHYRPIGDPMWYSKDNPEGTPEPLIDVGKCELVGKPNEYSQGAVKCENDAIGPHLSPKMITATSGDDLYNLWLSVGPSFEDEESAAASDEL